MGNLMKNNTAIQLIEKENVTFATVKEIRVLFDFNDSTFSPLAPGRAQDTKARQFGVIKFSYLWLKNESRESFMWLAWHLH